MAASRGEFIGDCLLPVALAVEVEMETSGVVPSDGAASENCAYGDVVPMPTLPPMKLAATGFVCVDEATYEEMVPREKMPEIPELIPPFKKRSPPMLAFSST